MSENEPARKIDTSTQEFLAFKVAQDAKKQIISWAKWILGVAILILAILGFRAYSDFQNKINGIDQQVVKKVEEVLLQNQNKINELTNNMLDHYVKSLVETQFESKETIENSKKAAETVKTETKLVMGLLEEYKGLIDRYKTEAETTREQLLSLSKRKSPFTDDKSVANEVDVFGNLRNLTLGISAVRGAMSAYDALINGEYRGVFVNAFVTALEDNKSDTNRDGKISIKEAFEASLVSIDQKKYPMEPVLSGELKSFVFGHKPSTVKEGKPVIKVRALIIGINEYGGNSMLRGCVNDANQFIEFLKRKSLYSDDKVRILFDKNATKINVEEGLKWLADTSTEKEDVIFFFSGHLGSIPYKNGKKVSAIYPVDAKNPVFIPSIALKLSKIDAGQKILIIE